MKPLIFFSVLLIVILLPIAFAAGGGGGGGGGGSGGGSSGGGGGGSGPFLRNLECTDAGVLSFEQSPLQKPVQITNLDDGIVMADVSGEWDGSSFTSDEATFIKSGTYQVYDPRNGNTTVECPGLQFSCTLVQLNLQSCHLGEEETTATFTLEGIGTSSDDLKYQFSALAELRKYTSEPGSSSPELRNLHITKSGNSYALRVPRALEVSKLQISYPQCVGKYYVYSTIDCVSEEATEGEAQSSASEQSGEQSKCGGYLDIEDRVKCRLDLREEQKDEYENFFPEECKSWADQQKCVQLYKQVQNCWKLPNSVARISCLQGKVGLTNVREQKSGCGTDAACLEKLRKDVYTLIKLRLYNLEEEAEELMEEGNLTKEEVADFVVKMEQSKLAFNQAQNKQERKRVIIQARTYWIELLKKVGA